MNPADEPTEQHEAEILRALKRQPGDARKVSPEEDELIARLQKLPGRLPDRSEPGQRVRYVGDYELLEPLGRGGMGVVYHARQLSLQRDVAVKMLLAGQFASSELRERFRREAEAVAHLDHPHIIPVYEIGEHLEQHYFSMKLVPGRSLSESRAEWTCAGNFTQQERRRRERAVAELMQKVVLAIHHAHQHGVLHRDVKPSNVLLDANNEPHVTDFGLAKELDGQANLTVTGAVLGTPAYMSPEQAAGQRDMTTAVDVYGLGAILYELLTNQPPFKCESSAQTLRMVLESDPKPPRSLNHKLDRDLETICLRCMRKDPRERYASAAELADELGRYLRGEPILARPVSSRERLLKWARRRPAAAALAAVSILGLVALIVGLAVSNRLISNAHQKTEAALGRERHASYLRTVSLAHRMILAHDVRRAEQLLDACPSEERDWEWFYLRRKTKGSLRSLATGGGYTWDLKFSKDGQFLAALIEKDKKLRVQIWHGETFAPARTLEDPALHALEAKYEVWVPSVSFSPDGKQLAAAVMETVEGRPVGVVRRWDTSTWKPLATNPLNFPEQFVLGVIFDSQGHCLAATKPQKREESRDAIVDMQMHDLESGEIRTKYQSRQRQLHPQFAPDGKHFATTNCGVDMYELDTGKQLGILDTGRTIIDFDYHPGGMLAVTSDIGGVVALFDVAKQQKKYTITAHNRAGLGVEFLPGGDRFATIGGDGMIRVWNTSDGVELTSLAGRGVLEKIAVHPRTGFIACSVSQDEVGVWNPQGDLLLREAKGDRRHGFGNWDVSRDGRWIAIGERYEYISVIDAAGGQIEKTLHIERPDRNFGTWLAMRPDGEQIAVALADYYKPQREGTLQIWDRATGEKRHEWNTVEQFFGLVWNGDGKILVGLARTEVVAWDARTQKEVWRKNHTPRSPSLAARPGSQELYLLASDSEALENNRIEVWDSHTGKAQRSLPATKRIADTLRFTPDGKTLIAGCRESNDSRQCVIEFIDVATGKLLYEIKGGSDYVIDVQLSENGKRLFAAYGDGNLLLFDRLTGEEIINLHDPDVDYSTFAVTPRGFVVALSYYNVEMYLLDGRAR